MKVIFSGGGTLGPVTPLLAIKETIEKNNNSKDIEFVWIGTKDGPEKKFLASENIRFKSITSGKFRRYFSFLNLFDIFKIIIAFFQSSFILAKENPSVCISAGGFVSVPIHFSAWILGIPTWIHQQDYKIGLANKLMSFGATIITTSLEEHLEKFSKKKSFWLGNPVREDILKGNLDYAQKIFNLKKDLPVVFVTGGGTGSLRVNQLIIEALPHLKDKAQLIHLSGITREKESLKNAEKLYNFYHNYPFFIEEMKHAYKIADIIISRGGFGTLTEISALNKPAIIIPKPGHQVENVLFLKKNNAVIFFDEKMMDGLNLAMEIKNLLNNKEKQKELSANLNKK
jgi:UDP-N-acetylglucosamine--N-acetylmuramyl-(pentapeptide) pyrophosphoryl-undecaprenol N-acetylglucosamine transferase